MLARLQLRSIELTLLQTLPKQEQPVTKGTSFADIELGEGNANYVKTYDVLVGDKGRKHLMPKRGIAILCWSVPLSSP